MQQQASGLDSGFARSRIESAGFLERKGMQIFTNMQCGPVLARRFAIPAKRIEQNENDFATVNKNFN